MPLVTLSLHAQHADGFVSSLLNAIHGALMASGVPADDRFQRVYRWSEGTVNMDPLYPDLQRPRGEHAVLIEILWSVGRSVKVKRALLSDLMQRLSLLGVDTEHVMVVFQETQWENWSFGGGRLLHA